MPTFRSYFLTIKQNQTRIIGFKPCSILWDRPNLIVWRIETRLYKFMDKKIKNFDKLAISELRKEALIIAEAGLDAIDTIKVLKNIIKIEDKSICINEEVCTIHKTQKIFFVGVGKCAIEAASFFEEALGERLVGGIALDVREPEVCTLKKIKCYGGTHPYPSDKNIEVSKEIVELLKNLKEEDLVIFVISGGGSTLLCLPDQGSTCIDEKVILQELFRSGATIQEINVVRKHISFARGGYLAKYAHPAQGLALIFVDVPGGEMAFVASGPTIKDETTIQDAEAILNKYNILQNCGMSHCGLIDTPKEDRYFKNMNNKVIVTNELALRAMEVKALELGYNVNVEVNGLRGDAKELGKRVADKLNGSPESSAFIYGGETTVKILHSGKGGRSQEAAISALRTIGDGEIILPFASDGRDNGEYAGAIADFETKEKAERFNLSIEQHLADNNSTAFFEKTGDLLICGDTGANVSDLLVALKK
ncbi:MAG: Glycerate 2-kinase [Parcubacteria group bacterium GW2011_GWB1_40_14]|nr:MAG: Glycerate 2-kinase [Parcubacteria group bacterium GW2011_GWB1_40_14]